MIYTVKIERKEKTDTVGLFILKKSAMSAMLNVWLNETDEWQKAKVINNFTRQEINSITPSAGIKMN